jgi:hypothetical protein
MLSTIKVIKYLFLCLIGSEVQVKVTKILRICHKKFCEYPPWFVKRSRFLVRSSSKMFCTWYIDLAQVETNFSSRCRVRDRDVGPRVTGSTFNICRFDIKSYWRRRKFYHHFINCFFQTLFPLNYISFLQTVEIWRLIVL